jgi:two-component system sensor histidine kinase BaeS
MRLRLFLSFTVVAIVAILSTILVVRRDASQQVRNYMFRGGMLGITTLVTNLESYYSNHSGWQGVETLLGPGRGSAEPGQGWNPAAGMMPMMNQRLRLADTTGLILADTIGNSIGSTISPAEMLHSIILQNSQNVTVGYLLIDGGMPFQRGDEVPLIRGINNAALQAGLLAIAIALVLALLLANRILQPIHQLTIAAKRFAAGDRSQQVIVRGNDELAALGNAFNSMVEALRQSEERRKSMTTDIAHELRTPLSVQKANLEALQDGIYPLTPENLIPILNQTELLSRLVEDLRTLALADSGELLLRNTQVNMAEILSQIEEHFKSAFDARHVQFNLTIGINEDKTLVFGDPDRLVQILNNLIQNAIRFTPEGGTINVSMDRKGDQLLILVSDSGLGIASESIPFVFERFYRSDRSRSREEGGTGLGLSIARQLAVAHGGDLLAGNNPQGGAVFTFIIPSQNS